ncbi:hypothetical protein Kpol_449p11 [Vanderwaltozyma polyspora DSM 70294]|uniref:Zn(2)-C6 fungal-type domain-containing protein n=1 Tax=Vanderwaltozyma polyspora (strain ATCC 22028 / DSM 70294 / BCRC 21397 / CBS 2163 / NBRC 10782 / NRRL Y-8283 / UCD 57-17) TaxID=436907 RepID=A7TR19_VANPO|nr:uncharacterized protein Kpol_449p11 [Vanderwaltozyma polyspora DSM 70294]EDO15294.1 hypothetical protein Kpol_449p11 [Vanderwaltozyma polyspora DSM 70294]
MEDKSKKRKRKNTTFYSRNGCLQCKKSHKKCDENKPSCLQCIKKNRQCTYTLNFVLEKLNMKKNPMSSFSVSNSSSSSSISSPVVTTTQSKESMIISDVKVPKQRFSEPPLSYGNITTHSPYTNTVPGHNYSYTPVPIPTANHSLGRDLAGHVHLETKQMFPHEPRYMSTNHINNITENNKHSNDNDNEPIDSMSFFNKANMRMINLLNFDGIESKHPVVLPMMGYNITANSRHDTQEKLFNTMMQVDPVRALVQSYTARNVQITSISLDDPSLLNFVWNYCNATMCFGQFMLFPQLKLNRMLSILNYFSKSYNILNTVITLATASSMKDSYQKEGVNDLFKIWDTYVRIPSMKTCISLLDKHLIEFDSYVDYIILAFSACILFIPNRTGIYPDWNLHLRGVFQIINKAETKFNESILSTTEGQYAYSLYRFIKSWFVRTEYCAYLCNENAFYLCKEIHLESNLEILYKHEGPTIQGRYDLVTGILLNVYPCLMKMVKEFLKFQQGNLSLNGLRILYYKLTYTDINHRDYMLRIGNSLMADINNSFNENDIYRSLDQIGDYKLAFSLKSCNTLIFEAIKAYLAIFYLNEDEKNPVVVVRYLEKALEAVYSTPNIDEMDLVCNCAIYNCALSSIIIKNQQLEGEFIKTLERMGQKGSYSAKNAISKLAHVKEVLVTRQYEQLLNPKYEYTIF